MSDYRDQITELLERAEALPHGASQVAICEEAVRLADRHQDMRAGFQARSQYVTATMFSGQPEKMLVAYSWLLSVFDHDPESYDAFELLWQYKWVIAALPDFPQISRRQIEEMLADMQRRYEEVGASLQAVWNKRRAAAVKMGDRTAAEHAHRELARHRRDELSDCRACEMDEEVEFAFFTADLERGVNRAKPILRGEFVCGEVPQITYAQLLRPLLQLGRGDEAMDYHLRGYRMISANPSEFVSQIAEHIEFLTLTDNLPRAGRLLEKHLALALDTTALSWRFDMYRAAKLFLERLHDKGHQTLKMRVPEYFPLYNEMSAYRVTELDGWFTQRLDEMAQRFDARNGNSYFRERIASVDKWRRQITPVPLPTRETDCAPPPAPRARWEK